MLNWFKELFKSQPSPSLEQVKDFLSIATVLEDDRREREIINLQVWLNKPIIVISNNDPYISVGFGKEITLITKANDPVLVYDCFSDSPEEVVQKMVLGSVIMLYDEFKLDSLLKLEPREIGYLFYGKYSYKEEEINSDFLYDRFHVKKKQNYLFWNNFGQAVEAHYHKG